MLLVVALFGCQNPCQDLCQTMATQAAECGLTVTQDELESCVTANQDALPEWMAQCAEANDPSRLSEWWTCEELAENYTNGAK